MRITIVQGAFLPVPALMGGAIEKVHHALGREFARNGHSVTHISRQHNDLPNREEVDGVEYLRIPGYDAPRSMLAMKWKDLCFSLGVLKHLPKADILVTNTFWLPILVRSRKFGVLYPVVQRFPKGQMRLYRHAGRLQTVSRAVADAIIEQAPMCREIVKVVPNPLPENWSITEESPLTKRERSILYVGRVHPEKGLELLLEAFQRLVEAGVSGWKLVIVGPAEFRFGGGGTEYLTALQTRFQAIGGSVEWVGPIFDNEALKQYYDRSMLFVYPSLAEKGETFGLAPLEAMARGCVPIVSDLACFRDFIEPNVNGYVFDHRTDQRAQNLANTIREVTVSLENLYTTQQNSLETATRFTIPKVAKLFLDDFQELLAPTQAKRITT